MAKAKSISHQLAYYRRLNKTPAGAARFAWQRVLAQVHHHPAYAHVRIRISREDFMTWAIPAYEAWFRDKPGIKPSIDRIDSAGHYEIANLQMIPHRQNCGKTCRAINAGLPSGRKQCGHCKQVLPFESFAKVKPNATGTFGLFGWCRECNRAFDRQRKPRQRKK